MVLTAVGKLGIGTTAPDDELQIGDYTDATETITIATSQDGTGRLRFNDNNNTEGVYIKSVGGAPGVAGGSMYFGNRWGSDTDIVTFDMINGRVGINCTPAAPLEVGGNNSIRWRGGHGGYYEWASDTSNTTTQISYLKATTAAGSLKTVASFAENSGNRIIGFGRDITNIQSCAGADLFIQNNGRVGISTTSPSTTLHVAGTITESSFRAMKTNISNIENILPAVLQMQGVKFDWKGKGKGKDNYGFIAEDTAEVLPHVVSYDEEGSPVGIQYTKMTAVLLEAIKEQQIQIDELKSKLN
jgi:hypothetical protein